jgi:hypothetical protein
MRPPLVERATDLEIRPGWRRGDAQLEADAIAFWERLGNLPPGTSAQDRARELVLGGYRDGRLIGVQTARIARLDQPRARFALVRTAVDREARRGHAAATMAYEGRDLLEAWALAHPEEKLAGIAAIVESDDLAEIARTPYWPGTRLMLAGYTKEGRQIRLSWFSHYRLD